jgi:hypothetical protein
MGTRPARESLGRLRTAGVVLITRTLTRLSAPRPVMAARKEAPLKRQSLKEVRASDRAGNPS